MVKQKGFGYAAEAILAVATILLFLFGAVEVEQGQQWSEFREQSSAEDLTYTLKQTGYTDHAIKNAETGSLQTAFSTLTERSTEVSGLVSNLPINENRIAFYTIDNKRHTQQLDEVESGDPCQDDLEEISSRSEEPVLRSEGIELQNSKTNTTYIGDLDPRISGGNGEQDYDSLWVDNGTECQFSDEEGPYNLEEIFKWEDEYYDIKWIDGDTDEMKLYQATQPVNFREKLDERVNSIETYTTVDTVNFSRLGSRTYQTAVFREDEALDDINSTEENRKITEDFLDTGSILFLANLNSNHFDEGKILDEAGFKHLSVSYEGSYSGGETQGVFNSNPGSQEVLTYYKGLGGPTPLSLQPSTKVISDTEDTTESGDALLKANENYNFSEWEDQTTSMSSVPPSGVIGEPDSDCYSETNRPLTEASVSLRKNNYDIINAELGTSDTYCQNNNDRAIKIDFDGNGYNDNEDGPYLNGEFVKVDNVTYAVNIKNSDSNPGCDEGDCVEFKLIGDRQVELVSRRTGFTNISGQKIALTGYENSYSDQDLTLLTSAIYWLRGDQTSFQGNQEPGGINSKTISGINNRTYLPYELDLRWSQ